MSAVCLRRADSSRTRFRDAFDEKTLTNNNCFVLVQKQTLLKIAWIELLFAPRFQRVIIWHIQILLSLSLDKNRSKVMRY